MAFDADNNGNNSSSVDTARFRKIAEDFLTHRGDDAAKLPTELREKLSDAVENAPIGLLAEMADGWAKHQLRDYMKLADVLASIRASAHTVDLADDSKPVPIEFSAIRSLLQVPGYLDSPCLNEKLDQFINMLGHVFVTDMRLGSFIPAYTKEPLIDLFLGYLDDVRDLARAAEPLIAWHTRMKRALEQRQAELN